MFSGKQPSLIVAATLLGVMLLSLVLLLGLGFWQGWFSMPLSSLPPIYWVFYAPLATASALYLVVIAFMPTITNSYTSLPSVITNATAAIFGVLLAADNLLKPIWTGDRLFGLTVGMFMLIQGTSGLVRFRLAKRQSAV